MQWPSDVFRVGLAREGHEFVTIDQDVANAGQEGVAEQGVAMVVGVNDGTGCNVGLRGTRTAGQEDDKLARAALGQRFGGAAARRPVRGSLAGFRCMPTLRIA